MTLNVFPNHTEDQGRKGGGGGGGCGTHVLWKKKRLSGRNSSLNLEENTDKNVGTFIDI